MLGILSTDTEQFDANRTTKQDMDWTIVPQREQQSVTPRNEAYDMWSRWSKSFAVNILGIMPSTTIERFSGTMPSQGS